MGKGSMTIGETLGRAICLAAIQENRCAELIDCLFDGGTCTVDPYTKKLVLISGEQLKGLIDGS